MEVRQKCASNVWVCPNDRQLALRAKLQTGWSVKSNMVHTTRRNSGLDDDERDVIVSVIQKAETLEKNEQLRVGKLVERLENMKRHAVGNGISTCVLCGDKFGLLIGAKHSRCNDCNKAVCSKCTVETDSAIGPTLQLCKICSEARELWKKSGAWFFSSLPPYQLPERGLGSRSTSRSHEDTSRGVKAVRSLMRYKWARNISQSCGESVSSVAANRLSGQQTTASTSDLSRDLSCESPVVPRRCSLSSEDDGQEVGCSPVRRITTYDRAASVTVRPCAPNILTDTDCQWRRSAPSLFQQSPAKSSLETMTGSSILDPTTFLTSATRSRSATRIRIGSSSSTNSQGGTISDASSECSTNDTRTTNTTTIKSLPTSIEFSLFLDPTAQTLSCHIDRVVDVWPVYCGGTADSYVKLHLYPASHKTNKLRTRVVTSSLSPVFDETLIYHNVTDHITGTSRLQITLLDEDRYGHDVLGECRIGLSKLPHCQDQHFSCPLLPIRGGRLGRCSGVYRGQLLLSLKYVTARQLLLVGIVRCTALTCVDPAGKVDAFAKVQLRPGNHKFCTTVKWRCTTAEFNEEFRVSCRRQHLPSCVLDIRMYDKDIGRSNELLGYVQLSIESRGDRLRHWFDALQYPDRRHDRWHSLSTDQPPQLPS